ncbi:MULTISPECIES: Z1 domain-containing protein [unclassified Nocardioides]|uniref:Z1 domain-containing protein n=1 Tax=unclassified Nocardioides TaxID=2615069 RepID=UPI0006F65623|nr:MULTISPECIES: Z1 domain-containing protein [unclassified Nocardioides]KRA31223.1 hypothetical protein ASD81_17320 [Nocardioides sp. Root614]KRA87844.1 hypothetical protein ASD84_17590 [Nocardioides sp. Root682]
MDTAFAYQQLVMLMHQHNISVHEAARRFAKGMGVQLEELQPAIAFFEQKAAQAAILNDPPGVGVGGVIAEAKVAPWYAGPQDGDPGWTKVRARLVATGMGSVIDEIDDASTKVVAQLANPALEGLSKKGLVIGYVQSGKTANYTSVIAKASDAGYRLVIVLSGTFENLREQTQTRLEQDLVDHTWSTLTKPDSDFLGHVQGAALLGHGVRTLMVVKKNASRLRRLRRWLADIPEDIRRRTPILLLDDEADQATPNSPTRANQITAINGCIRDIWKEIPSGTYVGYTATPFANVFMDPSDDDEMYPADFILSLPRPAAYFGAERLFGRESLGADDEPDDGLDMVRMVTDDEANQLRAPSKLADRLDFDPESPDSLVDALRWFVLATAVRRARGQANKHSSMLIHTTQYIDPHFAMQGRVEVLLGRWASNIESLRPEFEQAWVEEATRASDVASVPLPSWEDVWREVPATVSAVRVIVDNGRSQDRLDYNRKAADGSPIAETVVAIGGGTLSRGLTLEGLVVSYFSRSSNSYDTLLQMGRWFGFRVGYEDLPRIWMTAGLREDFRFLAQVEQEIRNDITHMEVENVTPRQLGLRVRAHPGRLEIVARNRMRFVQQVRVSYSAQRHQTIWLTEKDGDVVEQNLEAARSLVAASLATGDASRVGRRQRWALPAVSSATVAEFVRSYSFHENQRRMNAAQMSKWIDSFAQDCLWNVVVVGSGKQVVRNGSPHDLGTTDLGLEIAIPNNNRAPLKEPAGPNANIKALLSHEDWFADLDPALVAVETSDPASIRRKLAPQTGLVLLLPISAASVPQGKAIKLDSRREMDAVSGLVGVGIIFPEVGDAGVAGDGDFFAVVPDWEPEALDEEDDEIVLDELSEEIAE